MVKQQKKLFEFVNPYGVYIPTFAGGYYSFCLVSNSINPLNYPIDWKFYKKKNLDLVYYNRNIHKASFKLPNNLSNSDLYKQAGNSVTVELIAKLAKDIYKVLSI